MERVERFHAMLTSIKYLSFLVLAGGREEHWSFLGRRNYHGPSRPCPVSVSLSSLPSPQFISSHSLLARPCLPTWTLLRSLLGLLLATVVYPFSSDPCPIHAPNAMDNSKCRPNRSDEVHSKFMKTLPGEVLERPKRSTALLANQVLLSPRL